MSKTTKTTVPAYVPFVASLKLYIEENELPIQVREISKYVALESSVNGHKFYVPKSAVKLGLCETTLPIQHYNGARPMGKDNGKIKTAFLADLPLIQELVLPLLAGLEDCEHLPENKRGTSGKVTAKAINEYSKEELQDLIASME